MGNYISPFNVTIALLNDNEAWSHYELCLKNHDWTYEYSDDSRYWSNGNHERKYLDIIRNRLSRLDENRATELYNKYKVV
jgi:hypothetical protein